KPEDEEQVIGAGQDVLDAERQVATHHLPAARPCGDRERRAPGAEHGLELLAVQALDGEEGIDLRRRQVVEADDVALEPARAALDGPAERDAVGLVDGIGRTDLTAARGEHRLDVRARQAERRCPPAYLEHARAGFPQRQRRGIQPVCQPDGWGEAGSERTGPIQVRVSARCTAMASSAPKSCSSRDGDSAITCGGTENESPWRTALSGA